MTWNLDSYAPATEAEQAEREIVEDVARQEAARQAAQASLAGNGRAAREWGEIASAPLSTQHGEATDEARIASAEIATARFKRLRSGAWGIGGPSVLLREGATVPVEKRNGDVEDVVVGRVLWSNDDRAIATIRRGR